MRRFVGKTSPLIFGQTPIEGPTPWVSPNAWDIPGLVQSHWFAADAVLGGGNVVSIPDQAGLEDLVATGLGVPVTIGVWAPDGGPCLQFAGGCLSADGWGARASGIRVPVTTIVMRKFDVGAAYAQPVAWGDSLGGGEMDLQSR